MKQFGKKIKNKGLQLLSVALTDIRLHYRQFLSTNSMKIIVSILSFQLFLHLRVIRKKMLLAGGQCKRAAAILDLGEIVFQFVSVCCCFAD